MSSPASGKTAFVLAGGGSLGAVQVGMLKALARAGIVPDLVVGASVGAINGAFYAGDPTPSGVERIERIWRGLSRSDVFPFPFIQGCLGLAGRSSQFRTRPVCARSWSPCFRAASSKTAPCRARS